MTIKILTFQQVRFIKVYTIQTGEMCGPVFLNMILR